MQAENVERTAATFAVYYNTEWRSRGLPDPEDLPKAMRPLRMEEAVEILKVQPSRDDKSRAAIASGALALSVAQLARADLLRTTNARPFAIELMPALNSMLGTDANLVDTVLDATIRSPNERFFRAFETAFPSRFGLRNFAVSWSFRNCVTDVCVSIETKKSFAQFPELMDPRNWSKKAALVWKRSDPIQTVPTDIATQPDKLETAGAYEGLFFELAMFSLLTEISEYHNVLNIEIDFDGKQPPPPSKSLEFTYSQNFCIRSSLFFDLFEGPGGIDVDQGFGRCKELKDGFTRLTAYKRARFDQPRGLLNVLYNSLGTIYLTMLIEAFVLFAAVI